MLKTYIQLPQWIELLYVLVRKELKIRYKNSTLGYLWALANPFSFALVYYFAFKLIMRVEIPNYSVFLLTGMFPWVWIANSLIQATGCYRNNASLVKKVNMPRAILPLSSVVHEMVHFCFALPVLIFFILFTGGSFFTSWLYQLPLMIILQLAIVYPFALMLALFNVYVRDIEYLLGVGLSMLFFLTPIVYPISMVPEHYRVYVELSPLAVLIGNWRGILLEGKVDANQLTYCVMNGVLGIIFARHTYRKAAHRIGELL